jgi:hypothetical protein
MDGNLDRYIEMARSIRERAGEQDHQYFERLGKQVSQMMFGPDTPDAKPN